MTSPAESFVKSTHTALQHLHKLPAILRAPTVFVSLHQEMHQRSVSDTHIHALRWATFSRCLPHSQWPLAWGLANTPGKRVLVQAGYTCDLGMSLYLIPKFAWMMVATVRTVMLVLATDVVTRMLPVGLDSGGDDDGVVHLSWWMTPECGAGDEHWAWEFEHEMPCAWRACDWAWWSTALVFIMFSWV